MKKYANKPRVNENISYVKIKPMLNVVVTYVPGAPVTDTPVLSVKNMN